MGRQKQVYHPTRQEFPEDFPERLERFKDDAGLSWRGLARHLRLGRPQRAALAEWDEAVLGTSLRPLQSCRRDGTASPLSAGRRGPGGRRGMNRLTVISLGGGVQSSVMALMARQGDFDTIPDCAIFAATH